MSNHNKKVLAFATIGATACLSSALLLFRLATHAQTVIEGPLPTLSVGMSQREVEELLGAPKRNGRTVYRTSEPDAGPDLESQAFEKNDYQFGKQAWEVWYGADATVIWIRRWTQTDYVCDGRLTHLRKISWRERIFGLAEK